MKRSGGLGGQQAAHGPVPLWARKPVVSRDALGRASQQVERILPLYSALRRHIWSAGSDSGLLRIRERHGVGPAEGDKGTGASVLQGRTEGVCPASRRDS